ncbi:AAA family ATPase [Candidatus Pacearchaeota archaeon]|nr:AAA family ATPase [Candidatus Pacearchaeota archaeon]
MSGDGWYNGKDRRGEGGDPFSDGGSTNRYSQYNEQRSYERKKETMQEIANLPTLAWPERKIRKEVMEKFGVKVATSQEHGPGIIDKVFFPYRDRHGKITGYKKRDLRFDKYEDQHFSIIGHVKVDCQLFGQPEARKKAKRAYIVEGEVDQLSAYQSMLDHLLAQNKIPHTLVPVVVSVGLGTMNAKEHVANNAQFFSEFEQIALAFDNDEVSEIEKAKAEVIMRGKEATQDVGSYFASNNCFIYPWPDWANDPSDMVQRGYSKKLAQGLLFDLVPFQAEKICQFDDEMTFEQAMEGISEGLRIEGFPILMDKLKGFRRKEMIVLTSFSGVGKSTFGTEIMFQAAMQGEKVGLIMLEEDSKVTLNRYMARYLQVNPNDYQFAPKNCGKSLEQLREAWNWVNHPGRFSHLNHFGSIRTNELMAKIRSLVFTRGCKYILFDHISLAVSGLNLKNERGELDAAMTELAAFCSAHDVCIIVVSHLNRNGSTSAERNRERAVWRCVYMEDLRGSSALEGLAWCVIGIDKEDLPDGTRGRMRLRLLKNRTAAMTGECDTVQKDHHTGMYHDASGPEYEWSPD